MNLFAMAREGLRRVLVSALQRAVVTGQAQRLSKLRVKTNGDCVTADVTVRPVRPDPGAADRYLVVLEEAANIPLPEGKAVASAGVADGAAQAEEEPAARIAELERELKAKEEYLQATLEEAETANEELKSTNEETQSINEELQSANEELQSANEELETSKEELQSVNEELATVNAELQGKVADLSRANNRLSISAAAPSCAPRRCCAGHSPAGARSPRWFSSQSPSRAA